MPLNNYVLNGPSTVILADNRDPWVSWRNHVARAGAGRGGVDLVAAVGTAVRAPTAGWVQRRPNNGSAGNSMLFGHRDNPGWGDVFSHLSSYVGSNGQFFEQGAIIAYTGNTGGVAPHLHRHLEKGGVRYNPWDYFSGSAPAGTPSGTPYAYGLSSAAQLSLQRAMAHVGRYKGAHDGVFGPASVTGMQQWLKDLNLLPASYVVDGNPGPSYGTALQELAKAKGGYTGAIDGKIGPNTSAALVFWAETVVIVNGGGVPAKPGGGDYGFGLSTEAQSWSQWALTHLGLYSGLKDGIFGPSSVAAFQTYLKQRGLLAADYGVDGNPGHLYGVALQKLGQQHGYDGALDGVPGPKTSEAIIAWAKTIKPPVVTPPVDPPVEPPVVVPPANRWPTTGTFGLDVASPQRDIDFVRAKNEGAVFAIIKMGGLNVTPQYTAPYYRAQVDRARAAGLEVGHYYLLGLGQTPEQQAAYFVENLHDFRVNEDVLSLDNEKLDANGTRWNDADAARFIVEVIRLTGIDRARIWHYGGASDYRNNKPWPLVELTGARIWWAAYGANNGTRDHEPSILGAVSEVDVHQFSSVVDIAGYKMDGNWSPYPRAELFAEGIVVAPPEIPEVPDLTVIRAALTPLLNQIKQAADTAINVIK